MTKVIKDANYVLLNLNSEYCAGEKSNYYDGIVLEHRYGCTDSSILINEDFAYMSMLENYQSSLRLLP